MSTATSNSGLANAADSSRRSSQAGGETSVGGVASVVDTESIQQQMEQTANQIRGLFRRASLSGTDADNKEKAAGSATVAAVAATTTVAATSSAATKEKEKEKEKEKPDNSKEKETKELKVELPSKAKPPVSKPAPPARPPIRPPAPPRPSVGDDTDSSKRPPLTASSSEDSTEGATTPPTDATERAPGEDDTMKNLRKTFAGIFGDM